MIRKERVNVIIQSVIEKIEKNDLLSECIFIFNYGSSTMDLDNISNINMGIIIGDDDLKIHKWKKVIRYILKKCKSMPLFLSRKEFYSAMEFFSVQYLDMKYCHFKLYGIDLFEGLQIRTDDLLDMIEAELRAKYIRTKEAFFGYRTKPILKRFLFNLHTSINILLKYTVFFEVMNMPDKFKDLMIKNEKIDSYEIIAKAEDIEIVYDFFKLFFGLDLKNIRALHFCKYMNEKCEFNENFLKSIISEIYGLILFLEQRKERKVN